MKNITGTVAEGEDFFGRDKEQRQIWSKLRDNANLALLAPRRVGKTSLLKRLKATAYSQSYRVIYIDVGDAADERAFVERLSQAVLAEADGELILAKLESNPLVQFFRNIKKIGGFGVSLELEQQKQASWDKLGQGLMEALNALGNRWLVQIDELPVFLLKLLQPEGEAARQRAREFLYWLRRLRGDFKNIQWIAAGSIGLDAVAERYRLTDAVNDLTIFRLEAYEKSTADHFLEALADNYPLALPPTVRSHIIQRVGWPIPYHLQLVYSALRDHCDDRPAATRKDVDAVFENLLQPAHSSYFDTWRQRLQDELGKPDSDYALGLLNAVCQDPDGASRETLGLWLGSKLNNPDTKAEKQRYLLNVLVGDGYLIEAEGRYRFRSFLLREYWRRRVAP